MRGASRIEESSRFGVHQPNCEKLFNHYRFQMRKYFYLISLTIVEIIWGLAYSLIILYKFDSNIIPFSSEEYDFSNLNYCRNANESAVESETAVAYVLNAIWAFGQIGQILSLCISARLMRFLAARIKFGTLDNSSIVDSATCLVCGVILILSVVPYTYIISTLLVSILISFYFLNFLRSVRILKQTLLQNSIEKLVQFGKNKQEAKQYAWFARFSTIWGIGSFLMIFSDCLGQLITVLAIFMQSICSTRSIYYIAYQPVLHSKRQLLLLFKAGEVILIITDVLTVLSSSMCALPLLIVTCVIWFYIVCRAVSGKNKLKVRYNGSESSLNQRLITY